MVHYFSQICDKFPNISMTRTNKWLGRYFTLAHHEGNHFWMYVEQIKIIEFYTFENFSKFFSYLPFYENKFLEKLS